MNKEIQAELSAIEESDDVRILFAVESGSRAWGFPSADSDYDVRFVYARRPEWYLSVFQGRDVIEKPVSGLLDISGWDLKKSLQLLRKSNPALMEWLGSPIIYRQMPVAKDYRCFAQEAFLPLAACHHYRSMMKQHIAKSVSKERVRLKVYLYSLRPLLAAFWVLKHNRQPPTRFSELVNEFLPSGEIRTIVDRLIEIKSDGIEADTVARMPALDRYLAYGYAEIERMLPVAAKPRSCELFNQKFRAFLKASWIGE